MFTLWAYASRPRRVCSCSNMAGCSKSNGHNMGYPHFSKRMHIEVKMARNGGGLSNSQLAVSDICQEGPQHLHHRGRASTSTTNEMRPIPSSLIGNANR
jgi:hypothetical protein